MLALQAVAEASEQTKCILVNSQLLAKEHSSFAMLIYIGGLRLAQSDKLRIFLAEASLCIT
jgi:hypothetical protein